VLTSHCCLFFGCGPSNPTKSIRTHRVSLSELVRAYRTYPSERRYDGRVVQVFVPADPSRRFERGYVDAFRIMAERQGVVRFAASTERLDPTAHLVVTGTCRGLIRDGVQRSGGIDWYVLVEDCNVTQLTE